MAQVLEDVDAVACCIKNLGSRIPHTLASEDKPCDPNFVARATRPGKESLNLILKVSGDRRKDKAAKLRAARELRVLEMNNHGEFGDGCS